MKMYQQIDKWNRIVDVFYRAENPEDHLRTKYPYLNGDAYDDLKIGDIVKFTGTTTIKRIA